MKDQQAVSSLSKKIDLARCKGQWPAVLQLSKEYQKTNQHYSAVHDTVRYEAEFYQTLTNLKGHDNNGSQEIHLNDTPLQLHLTLTPQKAKSNTYIQALTHKVERILEKSTKANDFAEGEEYWQLQFAKIILARFHFELNHFDTALKLLQDLAIRVPATTSTSSILKNSENQLYSLVLLVQARAMKGVCLLLLQPTSSTASAECNDSDAEALKAFEAGWSAVRDYTPSFIRQYPILSYWSEECLYYSCLLQLKAKMVSKQKRTGGTDNILELFRAYAKLVSTASPQHHRRVFKHWTIFKHYIQYLLEILEAEKFHTEHHVVLEELISVLAQCRVLFESVLLHLSLSDKQRSYALQTCELMMRAYNKIWDHRLSTSSLKQLFQKQKVLERALQFLNLAKRFIASHCPTIARYIFFILIKLSYQNSAYREEARLALLRYLETMNIPIHCTNMDVSFDVKSIIANSKGEAVSDILDVISLGVYLCGHILTNTKKQQSASFNHAKFAFRMADIGNEIMLLANISHNEMQRMYMSVQCLRVPIFPSANHSNGRTIPINAEQLLNDLLLAYDERKQQPQQLKPVLTDGQHDWRNLYISSLYYAIHLRDINKSIQQAERSLAQNPHHIHSWHLLALLYSCPVSESSATASLTQAVETVRVGIAKCVSQLTSSLLSDSNVESLKQASEALIDMKMTEALLLMKIEGAEQALTAFQQAFGAYAQLSDLIESYNSLNQASNSGSRSNSLGSPVSSSGTITTIGTLNKGGISSRIYDRQRTTSSPSGAATVYNNVSTSPKARSTRSVSISNTTKTLSVAPETETINDDTAMKQHHPLHRDRRRRLFRRKSHKRNSNQHSLPLSPSSFSFLETTSDIVTGNQQQQQHQRRPSIRSTLSASYQKDLTDPEHTTPKRSYSATMTTSAVTHPLFASHSKSSDSLRHYSSDSSTTHSSNSTYRKALFQAKTAKTSNQNEKSLLRWRKLLISLWLMVFRIYATCSMHQEQYTEQQDFLREAYRALSEAEQVDPNDGDLCYYLGCLNLLSSSSNNSKKEEMKQVSFDAFSKAAFVFQHDLSQRALSSSTKYEFECYIMETFFKQQCYDVYDDADVWYQYAQFLAEATGDRDNMTDNERLMEKKCLLHALELYETMPARRFNDIQSLPVFLL